MTSKQPPIHLRIHADDDVVAEPVSKETALDRVCEAMSEATGWRIERTMEVLPDAVFSRTITSDGEPAERIVVLGDRCARAAARSSKDQVLRLVSELGDFAKEARHLRRLLVAREAELATAIPVVVNVGNDALKLAQRLQAVLQGGAAAIGCSSAGLYLLDEATEFLHLRSQWNLRDEQWLVPPRALAKSPYDVEALAGHAIALEEIHDDHRHRVPVACQSAICVPIASATNLLGTLWGFGPRPRSFSDHETNLWEIIAGRLAAELEREAIVRQQVVQVEHKNKDVWPDWSPRPGNTTDELCTESWGLTTRVDPMEMDRKVIVDIVPSRPGQVRAIAIASHDEDLAGATQASRAYARWLPDPNAATHVFDRIHRDLLQDSTGDCFLSAVEIDLEEATGRFQLRAAGNVESYVIRPYAWELLTASTSPLGDATATRVGCRADVMLGESDCGLVLLGAIPRGLRVHDTPELDGKYLAETLLRCHDLDLDHAADTLWRMIQQAHGIWRRIPSLMVIRRLARTSLAVAKR